MKKKLIILIALTLVFCVTFTLAACKKDTYIAKFNANGGTVTLDGKIVDPEFGVTCSVVNEPVAEKEGFHFLGWYLDEGFTQEVLSWPYTLTKNTVFYARWEAVAPTGSHTVTFETDGGSAIEMQQTNEIAQQPQSTKEGHVLVGWFDNFHFEGEPIAFPYTVTRDIILYAKWAQGSGYTLTFVPNDGDPIDKMFNVAIVYASQMPTAHKTGSQFDGWYLDQELETPVTFPYALTANTNFYAKWKSGSSTEEKAVVALVNAGSGATATLNGQPAVFYRTEDTNLPAIVGKDGDKLVLTNPTKVGATFDGWYTNASFTGEAITFPYTLDGNAYFYGKWTITATPTQGTAEELRQYLDKTVPANFAAGYGMLIQNTEGTVDNSYQYNYFVGNDVASVGFVPTGDSDNPWATDYVDWAFHRTEDTGDYWMLYLSDPEGAYEYNNNYYDTEAADKLDGYIHMVYLSKLHELSEAQFVKVGSGAGALWYATDTYVNEAGNLLLGNVSGDPVKYRSNYTELVLHFDANGALKDISATSQVVDTYSVGTGTGMTYYYYHHTITINEISADELATFPNEDSFTSDISRPSGLYPTLNPDDPNRNVTTGDREYTNAELSQALANLNSFTSYYTLAGNTFDGILYNPVTILTNGNVGQIVTDDYSYKMGEVTITQNAARDMYFVYNDDLDAFFLIAPNSNNSYDIYCDQYSYKNNYYYNQYLLGISGSGSAILFNCKYPAVSVKNLDASKFSYNLEGGFFEYKEPRTMTAAGQSLFGNVDLVYPEAGETETYVYLRVYMNGGKIAKVTAASQVQLYGDSREFFLKELVITDYAAPTVTLPAGITADSCIVPGEEKVGGSVDALATAIAGTNAVNFTYTDRFVYDDYDELGGVFKEGNSDKYIHYNGITRIAALGGEYYYLYFKNGKLYAQHSSRNQEYEVDLSWENNDVEKVNSWITWAYPISSLISADWFYEGKDGKFYGKADCMGQLSAVIARYSGSENYLEGDAVLPFSDSYRWTVELDFVSVEIASGKLMKFYYSGVILVKGIAGSHTKPFSGYATFSYEGTAISMPVSTTPDTTRPALQYYLNDNNSVSVTDLGIVSFDETEHATGYKLYVYGNDKNQTLITAIDDFTNGFDLKTVAELEVVAAEKTFYISLQALGDGATYLDGPLSKRQMVVLSTLPKLATPEVTISNGVITVGEVEGSNKFHWEVDLGQGTNNPQDVVNSGNKLDLSTINVSWQEKKTYKIIIVRQAQNSADYRDSDSVTVLYTPAKADGTTYIDDLFAPFDFSQSFSLSLTNQGIARNHWFNGGSPFDTATLLMGADKDLNAAADYRLVFKFWYDAASSKGKLIFYVYDNYGEGYSEKDVDLHPVHIVFRFTKVGNVLQGSFVKTRMGETVVDNKNYQMDLLFRGLSDINQSNFVEKSGSLSNYQGLVYDYTANMESDAALQQALANFSPLEELYGTTFTYTGLQATVGFQSNGTLCTGNGVTLLAQDADGNVVVIKLNVSVGGNYLANILD